MIFVKEHLITTLVARQVYSVLLRRVYVREIVAIKEVDMADGEDEYPTRLCTTYYLHAVICQTIRGVIRIKYQVIIICYRVDTHQQHQQHHANGLVEILMHKAFIVLVLAKIRRKKQISKYFAEFLHFRQMELVILVEDLFDCVHFQELGGTTCTDISTEIGDFVVQGHISLLA